MPPSTATKSSKPANPANTNAAPTPSVPAGAGNATPANEEVAAPAIDINATTSRIAELQAQIAEHQQNLAMARTTRLQNAHTEFGFPDTMSLIKALRAVAAGGTIGANSNTGTTRTRAVITEDTKAQVKKLVQEKKTGEEIAAALGISVPSVQNIKKELKLTRKSK